MNPNDDRVEAIFHAALELSGRGEREALLKAECGDDLALEARVRRLIAMHEDSSGLPESAPLSTGIALEMARLKPEESGERIGPYKLLQQIGEGGFGVVWMAEQEQPVRRRVALKIIKLGMDTKEVIARFEQERQALAMMEHPNIAKVFDAGATQYGRPFFVMELVRGVKITDYCDEQQLPTAERLALFIHVCQAVQHAHQKGIIHRDLKPSNILVTINDGEPVPKVIDFGVAKATQGRLTDATLFTQFEQMVGTPLYMSPEQAELTSLDIDTRSDIYSLGVLLYELLTGRTPIDTATMAQAGMDEIRRIIREVDPPRPSARVKTLDGNELTTAAKRRHTDAAKLPGALRGDLDWIVMKCLEKDRKRRYDTANALALDLQRHLANEIVTARPPTAAYLLGRLFRRHKLAVASGAAIFAAVLIGAAAAIWQGVRAERSAERAELEAHRAELEAERARGAEQRALATLAELSATAPVFAAQARELAGKGKLDEAIEKLSYAVKLRPGVPEYLVERGDLLRRQLRPAEAAASYRAALQLGPQAPRIEAMTALCERILAVPAGPDGKLSRESLLQLLAAMEQEGRPVAELLPVARLAGVEKKFTVEYWTPRLASVLLPADLKRMRLSLREDGLLALDLRSSKIADLSALAGMPLGELTLQSCNQLSDFTPLREFRMLTSLDLYGTKIANLAPLAGMPLVSLVLRQCPVSDLAPLRSMRLTKLDIDYTKVADLTPLAGMPLREFTAGSISATDFSPLTGAPLDFCYLSRSSVRDLAFLRGSPVRGLFLRGCRDVQNLGVLAELASLKTIELPAPYEDLSEAEIPAIAALRDHPSLRSIQPIENSTTLSVSGPANKEAFWKQWDDYQTTFAVLRRSSFKFSVQRLAEGSYAVRPSSMTSGDRRSLSDLSILKGLPITRLDLTGCKISDLSPIRDLPLTALCLSGNPLTDLSPLRGMPLQILDVGETGVSDLSPLKGAPLKFLNVRACARLTDVTALAEIPTLELLTLPLAARQLEALRTLPNLKRIGFNSKSGNSYTSYFSGRLDRLDSDSYLAPACTAEVFWATWDGLPWADALEAAGRKFSALQTTDGKWDVQIGDAKFSDCSIFKGAALRKLSLEKTAVADLSPLLGMPLQDLNVSETAVSDLSPLKGAPLKILNLSKCAQIADLTALAEIPTLEQIILPFTARQLEALRKLPNMKRIGFNSRLAGASSRLFSTGSYSFSTSTPPESPVCTAEIFWAAWDGMPWAGQLEAAGVKFSAGQDAEGKWNVQVSDPAFSDCSIFKGATLHGLSLANTAVADLRPIQNVPLGELQIDRSHVADLAPLRGTPLGAALRKLSLPNTGVTDFSPLASCAGLENLDAENTALADLSVVRGLKLRVARLAGTKVTDLSALAGMPLEEVTLEDTDVTDLRPLLQCPALKRLLLPLGAKDVQALRNLPALGSLAYFNIGWKTVADFFNELDKQRWLAVLREAGFKPRRGTRLLSDGTWNLVLTDPPASDLSILRGAPLSELTLRGTSVTDLAGLRGLPLKTLFLWETSVTDLTPLKGMPLEKVILRNSQVADLAPLRGMALRQLTLIDCPAITDLSALAEMKELTCVGLPANARDFEFLRVFPKLDRLSFDWDLQANRPSQTAVDFWSGQDAKK